MRFTTLLAFLSTLTLALAICTTIVFVDTDLDVWLVFVSLCCISLSGSLGGHRNQLSMRTLFFIGVLLFGCVGALLTNSDRYPGTLVGSARQLVLLTVSVQVIWLITRRSFDNGGRDSHRDSQRPRLSPNDSTMLPVLILIPATGAAYLTAGTSSIQSQLSSVMAVTCIVYAAMSVRNLRSRSVAKNLIIGIVIGASAVYILFIFAGGGRLNVLSLIFAVVWTTFPPSRFGTRNIVILVMLIGLPSAGSIEQTRNSDVSFTAIGGEDIVDGLDSVVSPLRVFGQILDEDERIDHGSASVVFSRPQSLGRTFLVPIVSTVPRSVWPSKPVGFGRLLVQRYSPGLAATSPGASWAGLYLGEWVYGFGTFFGVAIGSVVVGYGIKFLDKSGRSFENRTDRRSVALYTAYVLLAVNMPDYVWAGFFTFAVRGMYAALSVLLLFRIARLGRGRSGEPGRAKPKSSGSAACGVAAVDGRVPHREARLH